MQKPSDPWYGHLDSGQVLVTYSSARGLEDMRANARGFTLVELLVVVIIIGILAMLMIPNWIANEDKARLAQVKSNMHTAQVCAETIKTDLGSYPAGPSDLYPYYPQGGNTPGGTSGNLAINPYTGSPDPMYKESLASAADVVTMRATAPGAGPGSRGQVGYTSIDGGTSYAVCGLDNASKRIAVQAGTMVLSNQ